MKLRSYINLTPDAKLMQTVQVRLASDAAPGAPFILLGDLTHEHTLDNASGMQRYTVSHVVFQHVQEQVYLKHGIQDMQRIRIVNTGGFVLGTGFNVSHTSTYVKPGELIKVEFSILPANATKDGYWLRAENPTLIEITKDGSTTGKWELKFKGDGETILYFGVKNSHIHSMLPIQAWTTSYKP